ncbi:iron chelate uptake ABC transporter family permease subunit, partial [Thermus scotoductus]
MTQALPLALKRSLVFLWLVFLLLLALVLGVALGAVSLPVGEVVSALLGLKENPIVTEMRLPRVLGGMLVGAALGV